MSHYLIVEEVDEDEPVTSIAGPRSPTRPRVEIGAHPDGRRDPDLDLGVADRGAGAGESRLSMNDNVSAGLRGPLRPHASPTLRTTPGSPSGSNGDRAGRGRQCLAPGHRETPAVCWRTPAYAVAVRDGREVRYRASTDAAQRRPPPGSASGPAPGTADSRHWKREVRETQRSRSPSSRATRVGAVEGRIARISEKHGHPCAPNSADCGGRFAMEADIA